MRTLLLWVWMLSVAHATQVRYEQLPCPLDPDDTVRVYTQVSSNALGGYDSDLARYSSDGQFRTHAVSTCAQSLFSLRGDDMRQPLPPHLLPALSAALADARQGLADPSAPSVWERYEIAARMYQVLEAPPLTIAQLYLEASWTARDTVVGFHRGLEGPQAVQQLLLEGPRELDKPLTTDQRRTVLYSLARVAHRGGHAAQRESFLRQFEAVAPLSADEQQTLDTFRQIASVTEPHYQDMALQWLEAAREDESLSEAAMVQATYQMADLLRRRERGGEAQALYQEVVDHPACPERLREMASSLLEEVGG